MSFKHKQSNVGVKVQDGHESQEELYTRNTPIINKPFIGNPQIEWHKVDIIPVCGINVKEIAFITEAHNLKNLTNETIFNLQNL